MMMVPLSGLQEIFYFPNIASSLTAVQMKCLMWKVMSFSLEVRIHPAPPTLSWLSFVSLFLWLYVCLSVSLCLCLCVSNTDCLFLCVSVSVCVCPCHSLPCCDTVTAASLLLTSSVKGTKEESFKNRAFCLWGMIINLVFLVGKRKTTTVFC